MAFPKFRVKAITAPSELQIAGQIQISFAFLYFPKSSVILPISKYLENEVKKRYPKKNIELFVELVPPPDGVLTPKIWELFPGDSVTIRPRAKGLFTLKPSLPNQLMLSTVTGVVPYISIIREYLHNGEEDHHYYVLQGASHMNEFTYMKELHILANAHPELITYVPTVSRPHDKRNEDWSGEKGRVNNIVEKYIHEFSLSPKDTIVYTCGHPGMIKDVKARMIPRRYAVEEERFWKED